MGGGGVGESDDGTGAGGKRRRLRGREECAEGTAVVSVSGSKRSGEGRGRVRKGKVARGRVLEGTGRRGRGGGAEGGEENDRGAEGRGGQGKRARDLEAQADDEEDGGDTRRDGERTGVVGPVGGGLEVPGEDRGGRRRRARIQIRLGTSDESPGGDGFEGETEWQPDEERELPGTEDREADAEGHALTLDPG